MEKLKVLIAEDTLVYRKMLALAVESTGLATVECTASNGLLALERLKQHWIDVVLLDESMPELDGPATLARIRREYPQLPVIMIGGDGSDLATTQDSGAGVLDVVAKPPETDAEKSTERLKSQLQALFTQIHMGKLVMSSRAPAPPVSTRPQAPPQPPAQLWAQRKAPLPPEEETGIAQPSKRKRLTGVDLVVIASSTGGPVALEQVLFPLPPSFAKPILVVQHMPADFTRILAHTLSRKCAIPVAEAREGEAIAPGRILIAPGGCHMAVASQGKEKVIRLDKGPPVHGVRPAADVLFASLAREWARQRVLAIVLTGMGSDGMGGVAELKKHCDCYCLVQSEKTCVVYGMPRSVAEAGLADEVVDLPDISARVVRIVSGGV
ncbi:chemotaxis-specific protein-glutamate methyltransferase CheB [Heliobacterium gestii]|uniref:Protein-glutamate methylesterase/protein-glutamine glutaminase n=1 Tax=Heliomicrobium gestii TaxID=2699 RepID=A0A845LGK4_HELGE|nr:chemotaxis-specific protein-glutamate methyltransferase CheB [Heliomicrobium gestii]MBM7866070.1 two-component system chemotaxis response regulator CheB [Heliomicrobium gestii]MZP42603.1 chemotaxis-specific protein-glutamate methyltransferase CheB [Heliomicrobium gestii]